jgi:hypothetical protein
MQEQSEQHCKQQCVHQFVAKRQSLQMVTHGLERHQRDEHIQADYRPPDYGQWDDTRGYQVNQ